MNQFYSTFGKEAVSNTWVAKILSSYATENIVAFLVNSFKDNNKEDSYLELKLVYSIH